MGSWIAVVAVVAVVVVAVVAGVAVLRRRGATSAPTPPSAESRAPRAAAATPMTDLESALAKVTDRDGRPIREKIDAESVHVDPLRDPNDTGPLLRRALDSVAHHDDDRGDAVGTADGVPPRPNDPS